MPQDYLPYSEEQDGRRKILTKDYEAVRLHYKKSESLRATARYFGVDRKTIKFIVYPSWYQAWKDERRKRKAWANHRPTTANHTLAIRKTRAKKRRLGLAFTRQIKS